jgi:release factor glutamine methyltransferase
VNIKQALQKYISPNKISPLDAEILLSFVLRKTKEFILTHPEQELTKKQEAEIKKLMIRRKSGEPIAYLTNSKEFYGLDFYVDKYVLIPRPETETLVERIFNRVLNTKSQTLSTSIIDIGTGSGNIIISIAKNIPAKISRKFSFYGIDISEKALGVAKRNAEKNKVAKKIKFRKSDLLDHFLSSKNKIKNKKIIITANLPYVSSALYKKNIAGLRYEPKAALISKRNGLGHYIRLFKEIKNIIRVTNCQLLITILIEISPEQKKPILKLILKKLPDAKVDFHKDFAGKIRIGEISLIKN